MIMAYFNQKNLLLAISFFLLVNCKSPTKKNAAAPVNKNKKVIHQPVMESQTDSLKKVLDEKRKNKK